VSKSWFQLRFLLFCLNPHIYYELSGETEFPRNWDGENEPPKKILLMTGGQDEYDLITVKDASVDVVHKTHVKTRRFNKRNITALFEPGEIFETPNLRGFSHFVITASPDKRRYKEYLKKGALQYVYPSWTFGELLFARDIVEPLVSRAVKSLYTEASTVQRIKEFGPFIRYLIVPHPHKVISIRDDQEKSLEGLSLDVLSKVGRTIERGESKSIEVSHRILRYEVNRRKTEEDEDGVHEFDMYLKANTDLVPGSHFMAQKVLDRIRDLEEEKMLQILRPYFNFKTKSIQGITREVYQQLFAVWLQQSETTFMTWNFQPGVLNQNTWNLVETPEMTEKEGGHVPWRDMIDRVLYNPVDITYPFVDMFWKEGRVLHGVQVTTSDKHAKSFDTFEVKWLQEKLEAKLPASLDIDNADLDRDSNVIERVVIYYAYPPHVAHLMQQKGSVEASKVWDNLRKEGARRTQIEPYLDFFILYLSPASAMDKDVPRVDLSTSDHGDVMPRTSPNTSYDSKGAAEAKKEEEL